MSKYALIMQGVTKDIVAIAPSQKLTDVECFFKKKNFNYHISIAENGKLKGVLNLVDFLYAIKKASSDDHAVIYQKFLVKNIMKEYPVINPSSSLLKELASELLKDKKNAILIADERSLEGILSKVDVIRYLLKN